MRILHKYSFILSSSYTFHYLITVCNAQTSHPYVTTGLMRLVDCQFNISTEKPGFYDLFICITASVATLPYFIYYGVILIDLRS